MVMMFGMTAKELADRLNSDTVRLRLQKETLDLLGEVVKTQRETIEVRNRAIADLEEALKTKTLVCEQHEKMIADLERKYECRVKHIAELQGKLRDKEKDLFASMRICGRRVSSNEWGF